MRPWRSLNACSEVFRLVTRLDGTSKPAWAASCSIASFDTRVSLGDVNHAALLNKPYRTSVRARISRPRWRSTALRKSGASRPDTGKSRNRCHRRNQMARTLFGRTTQSAIRNSASLQQPSSLMSKDSRPVRSSPFRRIHSPPSASSQSITSSVVGSSSCLLSKTITQDLRHPCGCNLSYVARGGIPRKEPLPLVHISPNATARLARAPKARSRRVAPREVLTPPPSRGRSLIPRRCRPK